MPTDEERERSERIRREITGAVVRRPSDSASASASDAGEAGKVAGPTTPEDRYLQPAGFSRHKALLLVLVTVVVTLGLTYASSRLLGGRERVATAPALPPAAAPSPPPKNPLERFAESRGLKPVMEDVVFVTKGVYGGDLQYSAILKGKVRNVSTHPHKNVLILWMLYGGPDQLPFAVRGRPEGESVFLALIEYLDTKAEADFNITLDLYGGLSIESAEHVRNALRAGRHEAGLYVKAETATSRPERR